MTIVRNLEARHLSSAILTHLQMLMWEAISKFTACAGSPISSDKTAQHVCSLFPQIRFQRSPPEEQQRFHHPCCCKFLPQLTIQVSLRAMSVTCNVSANISKHTTVNWHDWQLLVSLSLVSEEWTACAEHVPQTPSHLDFFSFIFSSVAATSCTTNSFCFPIR